MKLRDLILIVTVVVLTALPVVSFAKPAHKVWRESRADITWQSQGEQMSVVFSLQSIDAAPNQRIDLVAEISTNLRSRKDRRWYHVVTSRKSVVIRGRERCILHYSQDFDGCLRNPQNYYNEGTGWYNYRFSLLPFSGCRTVIAVKDFGFLRRPKQNWISGVSTDICNDKLIDELAGYGHWKCSVSPEIEVGVRNYRSSPWDYRVKFTVKNDTKGKVYTATKRCVDESMGFVNDPHLGRIELHNNVWHYVYFPTDLVDANGRPAKFLPGRYRYGLDIDGKHIYGLARGEKGYSFSLAGGYSFNYADAKYDAKIFYNDIE